MAMPSVLTLGIGTLALLVAAVALLAIAGRQWRVFANFGQGAAGFATVIALVCAGGLYYHGRQNKPKIVLHPPVGLVSPLHSSGGKAVLLHVAVTVENKSSERVKILCPALDLIGLDASSPRHKIYYEDLVGSSLFDPPRGRAQFYRCVRDYEKDRREAERRLISTAAQARQAGREREAAVNDPEPAPLATTGARFPDIVMEPGESVSKGWDEIVDCRFEAVQVIFKVPKPGDVFDYEAKTLVPIAEACSASERSKRAAATLAAAKPRRHTGPRR